MTVGEDVVRLRFDDGGVAEVTLTRPDRMNVVNLEMRDALIEAFTAVRDNPEIRAMVLRAEGKHFSAGADVSEFGSAETIFEARRIRWDRDPWFLLRTLPVPKVAALHGYALGSGLEMSMMCDFRVAAPGTMVGLPESKLGMLPAAGGTRSISLWTPAPTALPLVLLGDPVPTEVAVRLGLIDTVVETGENVDDAARALARRLAEMPAVTLQTTLRLVHMAGEVPLDQGLSLARRMAQHMRDVSGVHDFRCQTEPGA